MRKHEDEIEWEITRGDEDLLVRVGYSWTWDRASRWPVIALGEALAPNGLFEPLRIAEQERIVEFLQDKMAEEEYDAH